VRARDERRAGKGGCMGMCARARSCVWMRVDPRRRQHACVIGARPHVHEHAPAGSAHMPAHLYLFHAGPRPLSACVRYGVCVCARARAGARLCLRAIVSSAGEFRQEGAQGQLSEEREAARRGRRARGGGCEQENPGNQARAQDALPRRWCAVRQARRQPCAFVVHWCPHAPCTRCTAAPC